MASPSESSRLQQQGILFMVAGTMIAPGMDAIAKFLGESLSPLLITWGRFTVQSILLATALVVAGGFSALRSNRPYIHLLRGVLLATATLCFFWALNHMPLAECIAVFFVQPMILTVLSAVFLGETIGWHRRIAVVAGFIGALIIIRPGTSSFTLYYLLPLLAAVFYASYLTVTRAHATADNSAVQLMTSGVGGVLFLSVWLLLAEIYPNSWSWTQPTVPQWGWLVCIGIIAALAHALIIMGMSRAPASVLAPFGYSEIIAATLLGWLIFGDWPNASAWLGVLIIIGSGCYVAWRETLQTS